MKAKGEWSITVEVKLEAIAPSAKLTLSATRDCYKRAQKALR
jgi:hypothetical protein